MDVAEKRVCPDCGPNPLPITSFYVTKVVKGRTYYSTRCQLHHGLRSRVSERRRKDENFIRLWTWFVDHPCIECGETNPLKLQLDHRDEKNHNVSSMMRQPWEKIRKELELCDVRCANCHAVKTAASRGHFARSDLRDYLAQWPENQEAYEKYAA